MRRSVFSLQPASMNHILCEIAWVAPGMRSKKVLLFFIDIADRFKFNEAVKYSFFTESGFPLLI